MKWTLLIAVMLLQCEQIGAQNAPVRSPLSPEVERDLLNRARAHFHPEWLPTDSPFHIDHAVCGTMALMGLASNWNRLPAAAKQTYAVLFQRPVLTDTAPSPSGHFLIHFNRTGSHAVDPVDVDKNGIPDYVDETARTFDAVWEKEITQMGYHPPPSDGDNIYDIYIKNLALESAYGFTYPINFPNNITPSYMEIDNNFTDTIYGSRGYNGLHVTAAHEFFHAIQFGYYADFDAAWWQEMSAVWMEEVNYPDVNDYYQYLSGSGNYAYFFDSPDKSLDYFSSSLHPFGGVVFPLHLSQLYGDETIRHVWETLLEKNPSTYHLADIDAAMPLGGFASPFPRFAAWNYLTGTRNRPGYYLEGANYPSVKLQTVTLTSGGTFSSTTAVDHLGATYIPIATSNLSGGLRATFTLGSSGDWTLLTLLISQGRIELLWPKSTTVVIPNINRYQQVVFIPMVTSLSGTRVSVSYTLSNGGNNTVPTDLVGDFDGNTHVNFSDFVAFASGYGLSHTHPNYNARCDLNGDGPINFTDFLIFASHFGE